MFSCREHRQHGRRAHDRSRASPVKRLDGLDRIVDLLHDLQTRAVAERSGEGRHTTTLATALKLDFGGTVVDTPGVREFGISGIRKHELADFFPEISNLSMQCRFSNCTHLAEPGCAVRTAVETGGFTKIRYHSYLQIFDTLPR